MSSLILEIAECQPSVLHVIANAIAADPLKPVQLSIAGVTMKCLVTRSDAPKPSLRITLMPLIEIGA